MRRIEAHGPFQIHGDADMMQSLDALAAGLRRAAADEDRRCVSTVLPGAGLTSRPPAGAAPAQSFDEPPRDALKGRASEPPDQAQLLAAESDFRRENRWRRNARRQALVPFG